MGLTNIKQELLDRKYLSTKEKMAERLASLGLKPLTDQEAERELVKATLLCSPDCPRCRGTGYVQKHPDLEVHDKGFGEIEMCPRYRAAQIKGMDLSRFGMEQAELALDWKDVKSRIGYLRLEGTRAVEAVKPKFEQGHGMIALLGSYGQGKTLVGKILIAKALLAGKRAAYANLARILDDIRVAFDHKDNMTQELLKRMEFWNSLEVLFVDELDKVNGTEWAWERMFQLLDQRYVRAVRESALTVIASNKADDELNGYLVSRLKDNRLGPVVYLNGEDARAVMPNGWRH